MIIIPTFEPYKSFEHNLWSVCYSGRANNSKVSKDIFSILFQLWGDTEYLHNFFLERRAKLKSYRPGWDISQAIDAVQDEALDFQQELKNIESKAQGYEKCSLTAIFKQLHKNEYALKPEYITFRKGQPYMERPLLRLYAIELENGCYVVTGGGIKIVEQMKHDALLNKENKKLEFVRDYLQSQGITSKTNLIEKYEELQISTEDRKQP